MTLNDLLPKILALCGQYGGGGIKANNTVEDYKAKIPLLADIGQRELLEAGRVFNVPCPSVSTLSQALTISDDCSVQALIYYISAFLLTEENPAKANLYLQKYEEQRKALQGRNVAAEEAIFDVYDTGRQ